MARQKGIIKLKGSIGDITFYKSKDGYLAREKGGINKERFLNDPNFNVRERMRQNLVALVKRVKHFVPQSGLY